LDGSQNIGRIEFDIWTVWFSKIHTKQIKNCRFFHESRRFLFNVFERTGTMFDSAF
jgi:hypothetical protein